MFDKKQKSCVKQIHLVTDDGLYDWKAFYKVKIVFYSSSIIDLNHVYKMNCRIFQKKISWFDISLIDLREFLVPRNVFVEFSGKKE